MLSQQLLYFVVVQQLILSHAQNFKSLILGDKTALNSKSLLSDLLSALIAELLHERLVVLLGEVVYDSAASLRLWEWPNAPLTLIEFHIGTNPEIVGRVLVNRC